MDDERFHLDNIERELEKEGEKLSDILSMPVKDALGRDVGVDYTDDISTIRDILDATIARRNIFIDSVELQKLTLEQVAHIHSYEKDATIAINWINDLYKVMIKTHIHVGCNVYEIQLQKEELQSLQETAKVWPSLFLLPARMEFILGFSFPEHLQLRLSATGCCTRSATVM